MTHVLPHLTWMAVKQGTLLQYQETRVNYSFSVKGPPEMFDQVFDHLYTSKKLKPVF